MSHTSKFFRGIYFQNVYDLADFMVAKKYAGPIVWILIVDIATLYKHPVSVEGIL